MVHGRTRQECLATLDAISERTGLRERAALWSVRELKKVRLRYFTPEWATWEARALAGAPGHPVLLKLAGKRVVVIGAGTVGERKIEALLEAQASVRVIAPAVTSRVEGWAAAG